MADLAGGVAIPISDDTYKDFADPSFKLSLKAGAVFYVSRHFGVTAEGQFDWVAVNTDDEHFKNTVLNIDATFNRVRFLAGSRFVIPFGIGSVYFRLALGLDYLFGSATYRPANVNVFTQDTRSAAFTFEPGFGLQFNVVRHLVLGVYTGFPINSDHTVDLAVAGGTKISSTFQPVDIDILGVIGFRL